MLEMNRKEILRDNTIKVNDTVNVHFEINCILYGMPKLKRERGKKMRKKSSWWCCILYDHQDIRPVKFCALYKSPLDETITG